jgi:hypothetical protein
MSVQMPILPSIANLHERHPGLTEAVARYYAESAAISMQRHHASPRSMSVAIDVAAPIDYVIVWDAPTRRQLAAWGNQDDTTRDAAYGVVIAAAEAHLGLFVTGRPPIRSGADYLVSPTPYKQEMDDPLDFEDRTASRLEVSGINRSGNDSVLENRLLVKVGQLRRAVTNYPGIAGVVAFDLARTRFRRA